MRLLISPFLLLLGGESRSATTFVRIWRDGSCVSLHRCLDERPRMAASTVGCKEPIRVNELGGLSALPFDAALPQLNNKSLVGALTKICIRRTHIASRFSISQKLCIRHFSKTARNSSTSIGTSVAKRYIWNLLLQRRQLCRIRYGESVDCVPKLPPAFHSIISRIARPLPERDRRNDCSRRRTLRLRALRLAGRKQPNSSTLSSDPQSLSS